MTRMLDILQDYMEYRGEEGEAWAFNVSTTYFTSHFNLIAKHKESFNI